MKKKFLHGKRIVSERFKILRRTIRQIRDGKKNSELQSFDFETLVSATNNFSDHCKLGEGGFGPVYKVFSFLSYYEGWRYYIFMLKDLKNYYLIDLDSSKDRILIWNKTKLYSNDMDSKSWIRSMDEVFFFGQS